MTKRKYSLRQRHLDATHCSYCDKRMYPVSDLPRDGATVTKDHLIPRSFALGPLKNLHRSDIAAGRGNGVWCCQQCNALKQDLFPDQLRVLADEHRKRAKLLEQIADRAEAIITERGLGPLPAIKTKGDE